ncbi:MAG: DUF2382 domain-containing protein [Akkermansiaceae bacterium]|nr:DUF2382 domain-containing protein [Armatimonadota bacterium]
MNHPSAVVTETEYSDQTTREGNIVIPVIEETLHVTKRVVEQGGVRIIKSVITEETTVEEPTVHEAASVDRVVINRLLEPGEALPKSRRERDTLIIPIFEEVVLTEKRMRITEELHILLTRTETVNPQTTTIRRESVQIEPLASTNDLRSTQD